MKRLLICLAAFSLLAFAPPEVARANAESGAVSLRAAVLPAGIDPVAANVTAGALDGAFKPVQLGGLVFDRGVARWYRLQLTADWRERSPPLLVIQGARFQPVTLFAAPDFRPLIQYHAQSGRDPRFSRRALVFELPRNLGAAQGIYLRVSASSKRMPFSAEVYPEEVYQAADIRWTRLMTFFEAVQLTMILVGLTLWLALREKLYGFFVGYLAPQFLYLLVSTGDLYLLPGSQWLEPLGIRVLWFVAALSTPFALSFLIEFCDMRRIAPHFARVLSGLRAPWVVLTLTSLLPMSFHAGNSLQPDIGNMLFLICGAVAILSVVVAWRRGSVAAGIFLLAWSPQSVFTALRAAQLLLATPLPGWLEFVLPASLSLSSLVLTLGLGVSTLQIRRERDRARDEAQHDALTGLHNRRALMVRMAEALTAARQAQQSLSLIFLDLDHFKVVNDHHGHLVGDACLRIVAERIQYELRPGDILARWGGEEFVVLLLHAGRPEAEAIGERIRRRVESDPFQAGGETVRLTVSLGVSGFGGAGQDSPEQLIEQADAALYRAKSGGRNCVAVYPAFGATA
ncbi:diguanylate cyclase [Rhodanobacter koreensis]